MTLSDIDEDDVVPPPRAPPAPVAAATKQAPPKQNAGVSLDDLFGDFASAAIVSPPPAPPPLNPTASTHMANDPLDMLFSNSPPPLSTASGGNTGGAVLYVDGNTDHESNLLDLSRPAARQKHQNADTFLDAFDRQCRRGAGGGGGGSGRFDNAESLAHLTRNTDDNKVRARLLALMNYYDVLGVSSTASTEEIRRSYKKKALELHPDRVGREQTAEEQELFKVITKANEVLTDDILRSKYDAELSASSGDTNGANWLNYVRND